MGHIKAHCGPHLVLGLDTPALHCPGSHGGSQVIPIVELDFHSLD